MHSIVFSQLIAGVAESRVLEHEYLIGLAVEEGARFSIISQDFPYLASEDVFIPT